MSDMHLFGNIRWREVDNHLLFFVFGEGHVIHEFVDSGLDEFIVEFDLEETFFVGCHWADEFILEMIFLNFFGEFDHCFATETGALFFVFVDIEFFHGWRGDVFALVFGTVLEEDVCFDAEWFVEDCSKVLFD